MERLTVYSAKNRSYKTTPEVVEILLPTGITPKQVTTPEIQINMQEWNDRNILPPADINANITSKKVNQTGNEEVEILLPNI